jgi:hypothetical protein
MSKEAHVWLLAAFQMVKQVYDIDQTPGAVFKKRQWL